MDITGKVDPRQGRPSNFGQFLEFDGGDWLVGYQEEEAQQLGPHFVDPEIAAQRERFGFAAHSVLDRVGYLFARVITVPQIEMLPPACKLVVRRTEYGVTFLIPERYSIVGKPIFEAIARLSEHNVTYSPSATFSFLKHTYKGGASFASEVDFVQYFRRYVPDEHALKDAWNQVPTERVDFHIVPVS